MRETLMHLLSVYPSLFTLPLLGHPENCDRSTILSDVPIGCYYSGKIGLNLDKYRDIWRSGRRLQHHDTLHRACNTRKRNPRRFQSGGKMEIDGRVREAEPHRAHPRLPMYMKPPPAVYNADLIHNLTPLHLSHPPCYMPLQRWEGGMCRLCGHRNKDEGDNSFKLEPGIYVRETTGSDDVATLMYLFSFGRW